VRSAITAIEYNEVQQATLDGRHGSRPFRVLSRFAICFAIGRVAIVSQTRRKSWRHVEPGQGSLAKARSITRHAHDITVRQMSQLKIALSIFYTWTGFPRAIPSGNPRGMLQPMPHRDGENNPEKCEGLHKDGRPWGVFFLVTTRCRPPSMPARGKVKRPCNVPCT
jgi:hypothetical protein